MFRAFTKEQAFKSSIRFVLVAFLILTIPSLNAQVKKSEIAPNPEINIQLKETADQHLAVEKKINQTENPSPSAIKILDTGVLQFETIETFFIKKNPAYPLCRLQKIFEIYQHEASMEEINHDIAIAQMLHETGYLHFKGDVNPNQFNFAGIGAIGQGIRGEVFPTLKIGIRAQIQHLKAYATTNPLHNEVVDPRYHLVRKGSATYLSDLTGKWAADPIYATSITKIINQLKKVQNEKNPLLEESHSN